MKANHTSTVRGFTLIELILAVGVAAIVLISINSVFFGALHLREATTTAVDEAAPIENTFTVLRRDLQCAVPPIPNGILSGSFKAGTVSSAGLNESVNIELYTATGALSSDTMTPWGDIQRVTYGLKNSTDMSSGGLDLIRSVTRNLLSTGTPEIDEQWLMGGVDSIQFFCFDGAQWLTEWDTTSLTSLNTNLPAAIRVRIQMAGNTGSRTAPAFEMVVPVDSQSRTNW